MRSDNQLVEVFSFHRHGGVYLHHCGIEPCVPGHSFGPAVRDHTLVHCVLKGGGDFFVGNRRFLVRAGEAFLILPGMVTTYTAHEQDPWQYCWVGFGGTDVPDILRLCGLGPDRLVFPYGAPPAKMEECVRQLLSSTRGNANPFRIMSQLYEFFAFLCGDAPFQQPHSQGIVDAAMDYAEKNYSYHISVEDMAQHVGVDRSHLFRIFKKALGISPQQYLLDCKLRRAAELLTTTDLRITEVMYSCGFRDPADFSRLFRRRFSMPPARYRQNPPASPERQEMFRKLDLN